MRSDPWLAERSRDDMSIQSYRNYFEVRELWRTHVTAVRPVNRPGAMLCNVKRGRTTQRVDSFERFALDESTVGLKCLVCQDDPAIGTRMMRLDCHVDHVFCEQCAVRWFEGHNTCPTCRQAFS